jgi:N-acetylmuramoyl-L-alanine amidase
MRVIIDGRRLPGNVKVSRDLLAVLRNIAENLSWGIRYDAAREVVLINTQDSTPPVGLNRILSETIETEGTRLDGKIICLDPGHGGEDTGSKGPAGTFEKENTLAIALLLREILEKNGATTVMTRETDKEAALPGATTEEELNARVNIANQIDADLFISIHNDFFHKPNISGSSVFHYSDTASEKLAKCVQEILVDKLGSKNRGAHFASLYVLRYTKMPAIVVEPAFISNPEEEMLISSAEGRQNTAESIFEGIVKFFRV